MRKSVNVDDRLQNEVRLLRDKVSELESLLDRARGAGGRAAAGVAAHERERLVEIMEVAIPKAIECGSYSHDTYPRRTDGAEIPASQITLSHKLPNGEVDFLSTIIRDVTERKRVETAPAEPEAKFRSIIQSSPMGVDCNRRCYA
jgi:PAS domain-containing protein